MAKHWISYYWLFLRELGREGYGTWRQELAASLVTVLFYYAIDRNDFDLRRGLLATAYTLAAFVVWHAIRIPWLLHKKQPHEHASWHWGIAGLVFVFGTLGIILFTGLWFYTMQPSVQLTMVPDGRDARIANLEMQVKTLTAKVPKEDSLKNRALDAANEYEKFWRDKERHKPTCNQTSTMSPAQQQAVIAPCATYELKSMAEYQQQFAPNIMAIVEEFRGKGVNVKDIENCAGVGYCGITISVQLRAFAARLDAQDNVKR